MKEYKNIKGIGLGIVAFDGTEHISNIVEEIKPFLKYVVVGLQVKSYNGEVMDPTDMNEIIKLKDQGIIDDYIFVDLDESKEPRARETDKRNFLIDTIEKNGCSHALIIDSDEFYSARDFEKALDQIDEENMEITYCRYVNYYYDYLHYLVYPFEEGNYVPFVSSVKYRFKYNGTDFPKPSDPTRRYERPRIKDSDGKEYYTVKYHELPWKTIKMHHLSWLRANINKKLYNWSAKTCFENYVELIDKSVIAYNKFDGSQEGFKANLLFNTPGNQVEVDAWPRQFIFPKHDFRTKLKVVPQSKKILILVMSMNHPQYEEQEQAIRETWGAEAEKNSYNKVIFYKGTDKETYYDESTSTLYVKNDDLLTHTYTKTLDAFDWIRKNLDFDFDYIFRTNTSTYVNVKLLEEYAMSLDKYEFMLHCGEIDCAWWSRMHFYGKGNALLMNKFYVERLLWLRNDELEKSFGSADDSILGATINLYCKKLGIDHKDYITSFGMHYELDEHLTEDSEELFNLIRDKIVISVKTVINSNDPINEERKFDVIKMRELHKFIELRREFQDIKGKFNLPLLLNQKVMWIEDKAEWLKRGPERCNTRYIVEHEQIPYDEAIKRLS